MDAPRSKAWTIHKVISFLLVWLDTIKFTEYIDLSIDFSINDLRQHCLTMRRPVVPSAKSIDHRVSNSTLVRISLSRGYDTANISYSGSGSSTIALGTYLPNYRISFFWKLGGSSSRFSRNFFHCAIINFILHPHKIPNGSSQDPWHIQGILFVVVQMASYSLLRIKFVWEAVPKTFCSRS